MAEAKPFASLSSNLLARKGTAKPAMRPQGWGQGMGLEDLGWNDMGSQQQQPPAQVLAFEERPEHQPSSIAALTPAPRAPAPEPAPVAPPPVVEQQRAIVASFAEPAPAPKAAPAVKVPVSPRRAPGSQAKAAFTLRLETDRHLKLRLACAVTHRSAQQIVTDALDVYLESLPEVDAMAGHVPAKSGRN